MKALTNQIANNLFINVPAEFANTVQIVEAPKKRTKHPKLDYVWSTRFIHQSALDKIVAQGVSQEGRVSSIKRTIGISQKAVTLLGWVETLIRLGAEESLIVPLILAFFACEGMNEEKAKIISAMNALAKGKTLYIDTPADEILINIALILNDNR
jgi:hypothetical protein